MTIQSVWQEMWEIVAADPADTHSRPVADLVGPDVRNPIVRGAYKGEPVKGYQETDTIVTVTPATGDSDYHNIAVRFYSIVGERPYEAQLACVTAFEALEAIMTDRFEYPQWTTGLNEATGCWVLEAIYPGPRE